ncbi:methyl-accepting chemotaxis protein [Paenibacillus glufosinatiresistens]|uniref:methyl-accepting chemotaxis protein n=1 Tax=Paenibacillus glufosinatiresistens TaxID=3070657 RepID=UPI00286D712C|nr:methyl-accepting chemotaxis protein [Paenibacillus sp. YX.27]
MKSRRSWNLTIRSKMIATYLLVLLAPSLVIGWTTYHSASSEIENELAGSARESVAAVNEIIASNIEAKLNDIAYFASQISSDAVNAEVESGKTGALKAKLDQYEALHPDALNLYVATSRAKLIQSSETALPAGYDPRKESFYVDALKHGQGAVISPAFRTPSGETAVAVSSVLKDGRGVVSIDLNLKQIKELTNLKVGREGYVVLIDNSKKFLVHPTETAGRESSDAYVRRMFEGSSGSFTYDYKGSRQMMLYQENEQTGWRVGGTISMSEIKEATGGIRDTAIAVVAVSVVIALGLIFLNIRSITRPLERLRAATENISRGDLSKPVGAFRRDEIGTLATHFQTMVDNLRGMIVGVQDMTDNVSSSAEELNAGAEQTTQAIEHVTIAIQEVAAATERQVRSVREGTESVAATAGEAVRITGYMNAVSEAMDRALNSASDGKESVLSVVEKMDGIQETVGELGEVIDRLNERAGHIGGIVGVIAGIARQTNLLALNASIEAARAGEQGRGFAVVANEVRKLAEESERSAQRIAEEIGSISEDMRQAGGTMNHARSKMSEGIAAVDTSGRSFSRIRRAVKEAAESIEAMEQAVRRLNTEKDSMEQSIGDIRHISTEVAENTETISAAAQQQLASVRRRSQQTGRTASRAGRTLPARGIRRAEPG